MADAGLTDILEEVARNHPDDPAVTFLGRTQTWADFAERARRQGSALRALGVGAGDRVGILALNSARFMEAFYGPFYADAVMVPLNYRWAVPEMIQCMEDCTPAVLLVDEEHVAQARKIKAHCAFCKHLVFIGEGPTPEGFLDYEDLLAQADPDVRSNRRGNDLAALFYTGGTTGRSKGVMLSHANLHANSTGALTSYHMPRDQSFLKSAPIFHLAAGARVYSLAQSNNHSVLMQRFDPREAQRLIEELKINDAMLVPSMLNMIFNAPDFGEFDLSSVKRITYGAAPMSLALLRRVMAALPGVQFYQGYGATETGPVISVLTPDAHDPDNPLVEKLSSVGRPVAHCDVRITAPDGSECATGVIGEVTVRGPNVMQGYWNMPEKTAEALVDGWYHTGDGGYFDADGYLFLVDRIKDMIISGGENVYCGEVENAIADHPAVKDCAVIGIPDPQWGEAVHAVVVLMDGQSVTAEELIAQCRTRIAGYKCPKSISFIDWMPLSGANKILKTELRAAHSAQTDPQ
ncbi:long-chain-fatty-acid--CoA ligase [Sulfitobacter sp. F26169L]|uniref:long-chain-fatty-acid--CoA ligase n=1 Tax=Sulfitobacter sp. F26169L TaxID=2996015 RepID=UPI0022608AE2|nr:long-chain-fatty-acid--CoA ligase [Sulfitobacter sp. F26169L]MCX7568112.1 long-chain-fatty-acid--CoA ligase [Sulfitobacter sp. F26169L]